jgi:hypothetical protein
MGIHVWQTLIHGRSAALLLLSVSIIPSLNGWEEKWPLRVCIVNHVNEGVLYHPLLDGALYYAHLSSDTTSFLVVAVKDTQEQNVKYTKQYLSQSKTT